MPVEAMSEPVSVSFILAAYNIRAYIQDCLNSVLACMREGDELIIVNDGSADDTREMAANSIAGYAAARIVDKPNGGLSSARNAGLRAARCSHVLFVDGDDVLVPQAIHEARQQLDLHHPDILVTDYLDWLEDGRGAMRPSRARTHAARILTHTPAAHLAQTLHDCIPCVWTRFFRRELFASLGTAPFPEWSMYDDLPTTPHVVAQAASLLYLPLATVQYRIRAGSLTQIRAPRSCTDMVKAAMRAHQAASHFPGDEAVQSAATLFLARKWRDAVKLSRQVHDQRLTIQRTMLHTIAPALLDLPLAQLAPLRESPLRSDRSAYKHLLIARQLPSLYAAAQAGLAWLKQTRGSRSS